MKSVLKITLGRLIGFLVFLVVLGVLNYLNYNPFGITGFLNGHLWLIITFTILLYLGELFLAFVFPLNLPAPIFNAFGGAFLTGFIFQIFYFISDVFYAFVFLEPIAIVLVFLLVLVIGYIMIIVDLFPKRAKEKKNAKKPDPNNPSWEEIGLELRKAFYYFAQQLKKAFKK